MCAKLWLVLYLCVKINAIEIVTDLNWTIRNKNGSISIPAHVSGGVYSDLHAAGVIGDILYRFNDVLTRWVAHDTWTYEGTVEIGDELDLKVANLVLHGVDTIAFVEVNDGPVGSTNNMFVRYVFDVKGHLKKGQNTIKVVFASPVEAAQNRSTDNYVEPDCVPSLYNGECHVNQLRKMQASFGWDWGPAFPSVGLWKPVTLEFYNSAILRSVTAHTQKVGKHWSLKIRAYLEANVKLKRWLGRMDAALTVEGPENITISKSIDQLILSDGSLEVALNLTISENVVRPWWPNGYGDQSLYNLRISIHSEQESHFKTIQVGFRTIELIEEPIKEILNTTDGKGLTFYFKVNGYPLFMKGSNWIPAHILPELGYDPKTVDGILEGAKDAHMNMIRVWGGGVYESDYFYRRCDQLGILVWQDLMFACSMYPVDRDFIATVRTEVEQNVKRIQHHPSIAVWAGNNENEAALSGNWYNTISNFSKYKQEYVKLYVDVIKPIINDVDPGRRYVVSSPSNGIKSEEEGYVAINPYDSHYGDTHYYNYLSDSWDMTIYPQTRFASEYGFQSYPSLLTLQSATNVSTDLLISSEFSNHRQHSPGGFKAVILQIDKHFKISHSGTDYDYYKKFVFYSQITQALAIKAETEYYRQNQADWYTMGALYWQLNDVWQAPSWSSIDYLRRWKMLHYYAVSFFAPVLVSPRLNPSTQNIDVYLINDKFVPITKAEIQVDYYNWSSLTPVMTKTFPAQVNALSAKIQDIDLNFWQYPDKNEVFLRFSLKAKGVKSSPYNFVFPKPIKSIQGLKKPTIKITISGALNPPPGYYKYWVDIKVDSIVLFLWLETPILHSYFEDNGFIITTPYVRTGFYSAEKITNEQLNDMITYQYYYEE